MTKKYKIKLENSRLKRQVRKLNTSIKKSMHPQKTTKATGKIIFVDIDETICYMPDEYKNLPELDYTYSIHSPTNIGIVNELYKNNRVVMYTARGARTGKDWQDFTKAQLAGWGVKYHELRFDKPHYDVMICDKCVNNFKDFLQKFGL